MPYNNNVPLATQQIAATQGPINGNFAFIQTDLDYDHKFNGNIDGTTPEGAHFKASMPSIATPTAAGNITGIYYANAGSPKFVNQAIDKYIVTNATLTNAASQTGSISITNAYQTVFTVPNGAAGTLWVYFTNAGSVVSTMISYNSLSGLLGTASIFTSPFLSFQTSGLAIQVKASSAGPFSAKWATSYLIP